MKIPYRTIAFLIAMFVLLPQNPAQAFSSTVTIATDHVSLNYRMAVLFPKPVPINISGVVNAASRASQINGTVQQTVASAYVRNFRLLMILSKSSLNTTISMDVYGVTTKQANGTFVVNLAWRSISFETPVNGTASIGIAGVQVRVPFDLSFASKIDLSMFAVPLSRWNVTVTSGNQALRWVDAREFTVNTPWGQFQTDPVQTIVLPAGASMVSRGQDKLSYTVAEQFGDLLPPTLFMLVFAGILVLLFLKRGEVSSFFEGIRLRGYGRQATNRRCIYCGSEVGTNARFCRQCGRPISHP